jgi:membrane protease YdiL (CAAX protease family)
MSEPQANEFFAVEQPTATASTADECCMQSDVEATAPAAAMQRLEITEFEPVPMTNVRPGPGLPESLGWLAAVLAGRLGASLVFTAVAVVYFMIGSGLTDTSQVMNRLMEPDVMAFLAGADQLLFGLMIAGAMVLRYGRGVVRILNMSPLRPLHVLMIVGLVLPLSTLCNALYGVAFLGWQSLTELLPFLAVLDELNTMEQVPRIISGTSLTALLLIIAVGPAVGEELLFRGLVGRGLVARWGLMRGIAFTSVLFGLMHMHPAHALSVIPLGVAIHLLYVGTRSFWAPMLLHFLNNGFAVTLAKLASSAEVDPTLADAAPSLVLMLASLTAVVVLGALLYRTRTRYLRPDGSEWDPGYFTVEVPGDETVQRINCGPVTGRNLLTAGSAWVAFGAAFVAEVAALAQ